MLIELAKYETPSRVKSYFKQISTYKKYPQTLFKFLLIIFYLKNVIFSTSYKTKHSLWSILTSFRACFTSRPFDLITILTLTFVLVLEMCWQRTKCWKIKEFTRGNVFCIPESFNTNISFLTTKSILSSETGSF